MASYDRKKWDAVISAAADAAAEKVAPTRKAEAITFTPIFVGRTPARKAALHTMTPAEEAFAKNFRESLARKAAPAPAKPTPQLNEPTAAQTAQDEAAFLTGKSLAPDRLQRLAQHGTTPSGRIGAMMALGRF
jgi:hypothetical protein